MTMIFFITCTRGERVREGKGREGRVCGRTHLCMSTRVDRKPRGRRKVGMLLQRNRLVEMVLRKRGEGGERKRKKKH